MNDRILRLREKIKSENIDGVLISNPQNVRYFSQFTGSLGYLIITDNISILITDFRYIEQAKKQTDFQVEKYEGKLTEIINRYLVSNGVKKLGIEESFITYDWYKKLSSNLSVQFINIDENIKKLRVIKDRNEIIDIRKAVQIAEKSLESIIKIIKPGISEKQIVLELEYELKKNGADGLSFDTIVASGSNSSLPHAIPTDKKIEFGDFVLIDFGCRYNGYCSDMTRTFIVGQASQKQKDIYNIVLEAQKKSLDYILADKICKDVDKIARDTINNYGYGDNFGHSLGHGVGLDVHEGPTLSQSIDTVLEEGMVVTVEPGIYIEKFGGVRIEDMVIITKDSTENLMKFPKKLLIL